MGGRYEFSQPEENLKKEVRAFRRVHPEWWILSDQTRCPKCAKEYPHNRRGLNFCRSHDFANEKWLLGGRGYDMIAVMAVRDPALKKELEAEGLR